MRRMALLLLLGTAASAASTAAAGRPDTTTAAGAVEPRTAGGSASTTAIPHDGAATATPMPQEGAAPKPHVLMLVADDFGWGNAGWHRPAGWDEVRTPRMNDLVKHGIELNRAYQYKFCSVHTQAIPHHTISSDAPVRLLVVALNMGLFSVAANPVLPPVRPPPRSR